MFESVTKKGRVKGQKVVVEVLEKGGAVLRVARKRDSKEGEFRLAFGQARTSDLATQLGGSFQRRLDKVMSIGFEISYALRSDVRRRVEQTCQQSGVVGCMARMGYPLPQNAHTPPPSTSFPLLRINSF